MPIKKTGNGYVMTISTTGSRWKQCPTSLKITNPASISRFRKNKFLAYFPHTNKLKSQ
jgi:hypothetical protein